MVKAGQKYKSKGYSPNHPVLIIPGLCSSAMKVVESPHKEWIDRRIWLDITTIGFGKVWDQMNLIRRNKKKKQQQPQKALEDQPKLQRAETQLTPVVTADNDEKRRWIAHMILGNDGVTDPPGIKLRAIETIHGIMYLDPGAITNALSYVFGPLVETLWDIGYTDQNLRAAPYDWRIPPCYLESRDKHFTKLKEKVDDMFTVNGGKKVVIIAHSLGTRCTHYFLRFAERHYGRQWVSDRIHTWIAVGPLFLGAPKSVRATTSGERMGLDAFLFEEEGVLLSRRCGSSGWMFPYLVPDYEFNGYVYRNRNGTYVGQSFKETCQESDIPHIWEAYENNYINDPLFGPQEDMLKPPPVDKIVSIYGINLKTEIFYFYKDSPGGLTKLELDPAGDFPNYVCHGGIAYETKDTRQNKLRGKRMGGDGTVPYASLSYASYWAKNIEVVPYELPGAEHREILKDKTFTRIVVEYVSHAPPPPQLPDSFKDLNYEVSEVRGNKKAERQLTLTKKGLHLSRGSTTIFHKKYSSIKSVKEIGSQQLELIFQGATSVIVLQSEKCKQLHQEICVRMKFIEATRTSAEETVDEKGQTDLHIAVLNNDIATVRELLSDDRDVNAQDNLQWTPLHIAANHGYWDIAQLLLQHPKIDTSLKTKDFTSPFCYAIRYARNETVENMEEIWDAFVAAGMDINGRGRNGETLLHEAVACKSIRAITWLIKQFANVNGRNDSGDTPLHYAVQHNDTSIIRILLENGADRHIQNKKGLTPISCAQKISSDLMTFLRDYKVSGYRVRAIYSYKRQTLDELEFDDGDRINNVKIVNEYGDGWWYGECNGNKGYFPSNYVKVSAEIVDESRPPLGAREPEDRPNDVRDEYGQTPLHTAAFSDNCDAVFSLLLKGQNNINAQDRNGWTPVHCAASQGALEVLLLLQQQPNIDLTKRSADGTTALHYVVRIRPTDKIAQEKLKTILDKFLSLVDVDILGKSDETALHQAVMRGNEFTSKYLLEHGASPNAVNDSGATPLIYAVQNNSFNLVQLLLSFGGDPTIASKRGSALELSTKVDPQIHQLCQNAAVRFKHNQKTKIILPVLPQRRNFNGSRIVPSTPRRDANIDLTASANIAMFGMNEDDSDVSEVDLNDDDFEEFDTSFSTSSSDIDQSLSTLLDKQFDNDGAAFEKAIFSYLISNIHNNDKELFRAAANGFIDNYSTAFNRKLKSSNSLGSPKGSSNNVFIGSRGTVSQTASTSSISTPGPGAPLSATAAAATLLAANSSEKKSKPSRKLWKRN